MEISDILNIVFRNDNRRVSMTTAMYSEWEDITDPEFKNEWPDHHLDIMLGLFPNSRLPKYWFSL